MSQRFEYKFVRLEQHAFWITGGAGLPSKVAQESYQDVVHAHAAQGWRLVQIFAPGVSSHGMAAYFELIFERVTST
jgi:Domain of unknown function (DUF4177)